MTIDDSFIAGLIKANFIFCASYKADIVVVTRNYVNETHAHKQE